MERDADRSRILYKTRLPFIIVFNKVDVEPHDFALEWMSDFEAYQRALNAANASEGGEGSYMNSLMGSMCLVLEEFYNNLRVSISPIQMNSERSLTCRRLVSAR